MTLRERQAADLEVACPLCASGPQVGCADLPAGIVHGARREVWCRMELVNEKVDFEDVRLSPAARAALIDGLDSARRGEVRPWDDFTKYADED